MKLQKIKKHFKKIAVASAILVVILFLMFVTSVFRNGEEILEVPIVKPTVEVLDLSKKPNFQISEVGVIKAEREIELIAKAAGTIDQIRFSVGDAVSEDDVIATIDFDESNNVAKINYDNARLQLSNARQNYSEIAGTSADTIRKAELRVDTLESTLGRLQRNLDELKQTNISTLATLELQLENAEKNADTADVSYQSIVSQFEQSWVDLFRNTKNSIDGIFVNLESNYITVTGIINPNNKSQVSTGDLNSSFGVRDSRQRSEVISTYNAIDNVLINIKASYLSSLPLNEDNLINVLDNVREGTDEMRDLLSQMRTLLDNSIISGNLPQSMLESYYAQIATAESRNLGDIGMLNQLEQNYQNLQLNQTTQVATAENNKIIANNQLSDAQNGLSQFQITSIGSIQDLESQIAQTSNDLLSAQADLTSSRRNSSIQTSGQALQIDTYENQLRLAEKSLDDNKIISTIDGTLSELQVDEGDYVTPGTFVGRVIQHGEVRVAFYVTKDIAERLKLGQAFDFKVTENGEREFVGFISKISPSADPVNKKFLIEGNISNEDLYLKPGMYVNLFADISGTTFDPDKIYIPLNSVIISQNEQYVFVAENNLAIKKNVTLNKILDGWTEISEGLTTQDMLIVEGHRNLEAGEAIQIKITN